MISCVNGRTVTPTRPRAELPELVYTISADLNRFTATPCQLAASNMTGFTPIVTGRPGDIFVVLPLRSL
jgi:hypothetical protein